MYRTLFALSVATAVFLAFVFVIASPPSRTFLWFAGVGPAPPAAAWVFGALFAIGVAALAFLIARHVIILSTALGGAIAAGLLVAMLFIDYPALEGGTAPPDLAWPSGGVWPAVVVAAVALPLAVGGACVQYKLTARLARGRQGSQDHKGAEAPAEGPTKGHARPKRQPPSPPPKRRPALT